MVVLAVEPWETVDVAMVSWEAVEKVEGGVGAAAMEVAV